MKTPKSVLRLGVAGWIFFAGTPVQAQQAQAQTEPQAADTDVKLGDIVVTARRRDEALQNVLMAITALSGETLADRGILSTEALRQTAPALNIFRNNRNEAGFYIRGQGPGIIGVFANNITGNTLFVDGGSHINGVAWAPEPEQVG
ncbi:hypothetical protein [Rhizorhabdus sp. FW153]|uniref:hypothetical protein n=1 Tax=Rhizorhabdus sp. FW153 TaxID=3400216 RepID=UPI003CE9D8E1